MFTSDNGGLWHWWDFRASDDGGAAPHAARDRYVRDRGHRSNAGWRGTKADIFEGGHRIPLVVRSPGEVAAGTTSKALVVLTDLYATVSQRSGARPGASRGQDSIALLPVLRGHSRSEGYSGPPLRSGHVRHLEGELEAHRGTGLWRIHGAEVD